MLLHDLLAVLRDIAPERLAEGWDKVGLQVGDPGRDVDSALLCIDLTDAVLDEAAQGGHALVVAYHPVIFEPLASLSALNPRGRLLLRCAERGIAAYCPHTALDAASGGVNDHLVGAFGPGERRAIRAWAGAGAAPGSHVKLVVFTPASHVDALRRALAGAGAGRIGAYTDCSFSLLGEGTFLGGPATQPAVGRAGVLERVPEARMEMVCPKDRLAEALAALRRTHPYEEPAFDLQALWDPPAATPAEQGAGQGRVVLLEEPITGAELVRRLCARLRVRRVDAAWPSPRRKIRTVAACAGSGGSLLKEAGDIDAFVTGEMGHHQVLAAVGSGVAVLLAGHTETERPYLPVYQRELRRRTGPAVRWRISRADRPPLRRG